VKSWHILALDAGTTGNRAILFDEKMRAVRSAYRELPVAFPRPGWVEQDPREIRDGGLAVLREAAAGVDPSAIAAIGITNQRETVVAWNRATGEPLGPAIVWQDRRTADFCRELKDQGLASEIREKTGLPLDPYFSASKLRWMLRNGTLPAGAAAGTVDAWVLWNLTGGKRHATDLSNASRTMLCDIRTGNWDADLCRIFEIPPSILPEITDSGGALATADASILGSPVPIRAVVGDQQGALFGQACFARGETKATFGTGLFVVCNAGGRVPVSDTLLSTVGWRIAGETVYALEGSAFVAGAAVQWLRDGLGFLSSAAESEAIARSVPDNGGVYFVPALAGLGTPHWDAAARGLFIGLTRGSSRAHLVRAVLEAIAFQARELVDLVENALGVRAADLRVDGGATENAFLMSFLASLLGRPVRRSASAELTAAGAAGIAGTSAGLWSPSDFASLLPAGRTFPPSDPAPEAELDRWKDAVSRSLHWA
jgi:glycerol kinase